MTISERDEHLSRLVRFAVTKDAGLAGLLLWVPFKHSKNRIARAYTDGKAVYFTDDFFLIKSEREQLFIVLHEILHVAMQHVQRGKRLRMQEGQDYEHMLHNVATDAVINYALAQNCRFVEQPQDTVNISTILTWEDTRNKSLERWTSDDIYKWLKEKTKDNRERLRDSLKKFLDDLENGRGTPIDLDPCNDNKEDQEGHKSQQESRVWYERVKRAQAGSGSTGMLRNFNDIPKVNTPWEKHMRDFLIARLMPELESSWTRPSRRTLSMTEFMDFAEAGLDRRRGVKRIGIVVDTSGSITENIIARFIAEINAILTKTGAECVLMDCDDRVHQVLTFRNRIPKSYQPKGHGGTDFRPAITEMGKYKPDALVYLTDTYGSFPTEPPSFPVLWATWTEGHIPWGRKVVLNDVQ
jgi:predicted metal-dependent peptidase